MELEELKALIASNLDVLEFLDIIGFSMPELVEALKDEIEEHFDKLVDAVDQY